MGKPPLHSYALEYISCILFPRNNNIQTCTLFNIIRTLATQFRTLDGRLLLSIYKPLKLYSTSVDYRYRLPHSQANSVIRTTNSIITVTNQINSISYYSPRQNL